MQVAQKHRDSGVWGVSEVNEHSTPTTPVSRRSSLFEARIRGYSDSSTSGSPHVSVLARQVNVNAREQHRDLPHTPVKMTGLARGQFAPSPTPRGTLFLESPTPAKSGLFLNHDINRSASIRESRPTPVSPSRLLHSRLNPQLDPKLRTESLTPPPEGCILPYPHPFQASSIQGETNNGTPAWWCSHDKLVIFDGITIDNKTGEPSALTRTSKGLKIATKDGTTEVAQLPLDCDHCKRLLGRDVWVFAAKVCPRSVCKDCKEICRQIHARTSVGVHASAAEIRTIRRNSREEQPNQESEERTDDVFPNNNNIPADAQTIASTLGEQPFLGAGRSTEEDKLNTQATRETSRISIAGDISHALQRRPEIEESTADQYVNSTDYHEEQHSRIRESTPEKHASTAMSEADDPMLSEFQLTLKNHDPMAISLVNPTDADHQQGIQPGPNLETAETPPHIAG